MILFCMNGCNDEIIEQIPDIIHLNTTPGGCNNQDFSSLKSATIENDTVYFSLINDTLSLFAGINYICCAPFTSEVNVSNDSIFVSLNDTCDESTGICYCRCNCYYTWEFLFGDFMEGTYYLKVELNDPRQNEATPVFEGLIDVGI